MNVTAVSVQIGSRSAKHLEFAVPARDAPLAARWPGGKAAAGTMQSPCESEVFWQRDFIALAARGTSQAERLVAAVKTDGGAMIVAWPNRAGGGAADCPALRVRSAFDTKSSSCSRPTARSCAMYRTDPPWMSTIRCKRKGIPQGRESTQP